MGRLKNWLKKRRSKNIRVTKEYLEERLRSPYKQADGSYDYWVRDRHGKKLYYDWDAVTGDIDKVSDIVDEARTIEENKIAKERKEAFEMTGHVFNFLTFVAGIFLKGHPAGKILTGIKLFKPIYNWMIGRKEHYMKLEDLKHLNKDTGEVLLLICSLGNGLGSALEDGKLGITDAIHLTGAVKALPAAMSDAAKFSLETDAERDEAVAFVKSNFDIPQDKIEAMIENGLVAIEKLVEVIKLFKK